MSEDIIDRINNRIHDSLMPTERLLDEAAAEIVRLREALKAGDAAILDEIDRRTGFPRDNKGDEEVKTN